ncbi:MAG: stage II sporulation protein R [Clostridia bacterium]|nr:stage II sporulation protein R [Clostridia bacterium]
MRKIIFPILLSLAAFLAIGIYTNAQDTRSENVIRLHVIANSDTKKDQAVKLLVRDAILDAFSATAKCENKANAEEKIKMNLDLAEQAANKVLSENGFSYCARAEYGEYDFPTRTYGSVTLPAGKYSGLRIHLGEGIGQNWWCVMYPPLCFNELNSDTTQTDSNSVSFEIKFKFTEVLQNFKQAL